MALLQCGMASGQVDFARQGFCELCRQPARNFGNSEHLSKNLRKNLL